MSRVGQDIFAGVIPFAGQPMGPGGFSSPGQAFAGQEWKPTGTNTPSFAQAGQAPRSHGAISLKSVDFLQYTYLCPNWGDDSHKYISPEMLCYAVKSIDPQDSSTIILTLPKCNQLSKDCYHEYKDMIQNRDPIAEKFNKYLTTYGENALYTFHHLGFEKYQSLSNATEASEMKDFHDMATQDMYCWLTQYGIHSRINFLGVVINTNGASSYQELDQTAYSAHYTQVNVGYAKRIRCANVFGSSEKITTGSKLWITLKRRFAETITGPTFTYFQFIPGGSNIEDGPLQCEMSYVDPSGRRVRGHRWHVGIVMFPGSRSPQPKEIENASNLSTLCNERMACDDHGGLPTLIISLGFKH